jgi:hypothetical protein
VICTLSAAIGHYTNAFAGATTQGEAVDKSRLSWFGTSNRCYKISVDQSLSTRSIIGLPASLRGAGIGSRHLGEVGGFAICRHDPSRHRPTAGGSVSRFLSRSPHPHLRPDFENAARVVFLDSFQPVRDKKKKATHALNEY